MVLRENNLKALPPEALIHIIADQKNQISILIDKVGPNINAHIYNQFGDIMTQSPKKVSTYDLKNSQFAGGLIDAETVNAEQIGGIINNLSPAQKQTLAESAAEIQQLLEQLDQTYPTNTPLEKQQLVTEALTQIESNPALKQRLIGALKAGGTEAFKELVDHPLVNILVATLEGWQQAE